MKKVIDRKFCIAPMMGYTTPYARSLYRILSKKAFLFTEMIATKTLIHSKNTQSIIASKLQNPIALQVGGSEYDDLKKCSKLAFELNYDEINLNVGCPSKAVQKGSFGACLMQDKILVKNCLEAMQINKNIEVSIKCRIGLGRKFNYDYFEEFIDEILKSGIKIIYVHARNAILNGISPKGNRSIPPLNYEFIKKIKSKYPNITFILNGGIGSIEKALTLSKYHDGVMLGRLIQNNPFCLKNVDNLFYNEPSQYIISENTIKEYFNFIRPKVGKDSVYRLLSPLLNIFFGVPDGKQFKIDVHSNMKNQNFDILEKILLNFVKEKKLFIN
ncbi:MAG: tRNA dihydrouridine(20/20a) synthase DusA [Flavobacteriaceae bacterium]|jgi:tRNA-dihydrouridine synthase A|nr:tRNA dihydrouridine(20/20a) synthase DusA [Pelagibacteraceae bacterium]MBT5857690.1 tRNA dihydrouridine(20/20a) synthase DusA [Flavobacteriaceae bacterium]MBT6353394.1 tRNA dihydrouridine(20/20a) synthase DusA [Pelagibacteraceae bacterium]